MDPKSVLGKTYVIDANHVWDSCDKGFNNGGSGIGAITWFEIRAENNTKFFKELKFAPKDLGRSPYDLTMFSNIFSMKIKLDKCAEWKGVTPFVPSYMFSVVEYSDSSGQFKHEATLRTALSAYNSAQYDDERMIPVSCFDTLLNLGFIMEDVSVSTEDHTGMIYNPVTGCWTWGFI